MPQPVTSSHILLAGKLPFTGPCLSRALANASSLQRIPSVALPLVGEFASPSCDEISFCIAEATTSRETQRQVEAASAEGRAFSVALIGELDEGSWTSRDAVRHLLSADPDVQVVASLKEEELEGCGGDTASDGWLQSPRLLAVDHPLTLRFARSCCLTLTEKWMMARRLQVGSEHASRYLLDGEKVSRTIDTCLLDLESANHELRRYSAELAHRLRLRTDELMGTRDLAMFALAQLADSRDLETGEHLERMRAYAQLVAETLRRSGLYHELIDDSFLEDFFRSTPLHDIGKVGIPDQILLKPGKLTPAEFDIMKCHTVIGAEALEKTARRSSHGAFLTMAADIARHHHEKFDGSGYPHGLVGQAIPLTARITAIADVFDALTSARVYKEAMRPADALNLLARESGRHFDPVIVTAFESCFDEALAIKSRIDHPDEIGSLVAL